MKVTCDHGKNSKNNRKQHNEFKNKTLHLLEPLPKDTHYNFSNIILEIVQADTLFKFPHLKIENNNITSNDCFIKCLKRCTTYRRLPYI